ncbi:hypothetical protein, partial [Lysinibacillus sp. PWR01]|uniref:hypothetical protein n=1 Tax=Lysinibacillus sp. PWR01 TaxID=3342384 RepID=UPI00372D861E
MKRLIGRPLERTLAERKSTPRLAKRSFFNIIKCQMNIMVLLAFRSVETKTINRIFVIMNFRYRLLASFSTAP